MTRVWRLLYDRKRAQRGSVLSSVLIITAFLAIVGGALMTELSTNFLISRNLLDRVNNQATLNSALEVSVSELQSTPLNAPCPSLPGAVTLNNRTASPAYTSCWPTVDVRSQRFQQIGSSSTSFTIDGTHAPGPSQNGDYIVASAGGTVLNYPFGGQSPRWTLSLNGTITATPLVFQDPTNGARYFDVIPLAGPGCGASAYCLSVWSDTGSSSLTQQCSIPTGFPVQSQPAASPTNSNRAYSNPSALIYFGDGSRLESNDVLPGGAGCDPEAPPTQAQGSTLPVVAGPIAFPCTSRCRQGADYIYALVSDANSSRLVEFSGDFSLNYVTYQQLPWAGAIGLATSGKTLPAKVAITFQGGGVAIVQIASDGSMSLSLTASVPAGISDAPYWCTQCGGLIGAGALNGGLYVFDQSLSLVGNYMAGSPIRTTPGADGGGNWYFGADDGYVHEIQLWGGQGTQVNTYGGLGQVGSSVQVGGCSIGICVYLGALDNAYLIPLDARDAVITACISTSPPSCSGAGPRLWASLEVGDARSLQTVHIQGWSYYSP